MYSCRLHSYRFNDTDTSRHTTECVREKKYIAQDSNNYDLSTESI